MLTEFGSGAPRVWRNNKARHSDTIINRIHLICNLIVVAGGLLLVSHVLFYTGAWYGFIKFGFISKRFSVDPFIRFGHCQSLDTIFAWSFICYLLQKLSLLRVLSCTKLPLIQEQLTLWYLIIRVIVHSLYRCIVRNTITFSTWSKFILQRLVRSKVQS